MRSLKALIIMTVLLIAYQANAACILGMGSCKPTEEDGQAVLLRRLQGIFVPPWTVTSFKKTNGTSGNLGGVDVYDMEFIAIISYPTPQLKCHSPLCPELVGKYIVQVDEAKKLVAIGGHLSFHKTENGWVGK